MFVHNVAQFAIDYGTDLLDGMLGDQGVEQDNYSEVPEAWNKGIRVAWVLGAVNDLDLRDVDISLLGLEPNSCLELFIL